MKAMRPKRKNDWFRADAMKALSDEASANKIDNFTRLALEEIKAAAGHGMLNCILVPPSWVKPENEHDWQITVAIRLSDFGYKTTNVRVDEWGAGLTANKSPEFSIRAEWGKS